MENLINFSVIVATYNSGKTLRRCIDSILPQLGNDSELLIIDGGSTDDTMDIVRSYSSGIAYSISEKDRGVYDAWNKGIAVSRGKWITFIGSDDMMLPGAFDHYRKFLSDNHEDYDIICAKLYYVNGEGRIIREVGEPWDWNLMVHRKLNFAHPGLLHNRKLFDRIGYFNLKYKICADSDFLQRIGPDSKGGYIDEFLVRMSQGGMSDGYRALKEGFITRKDNKCIPLWLNCWYHFKSLIRYYGGIILRRMHLK